jgi:hypothetical protein
VGQLLAINYKSVGVQDVVARCDVALVCCSGQQAAAERNSLSGLPIDCHQ